MKEKRMPVSYVGKMIRDAREERNLTIEELVEKINKPNITVNLWKKWENGKEFPDLDCIYILAEELDLNPNEMLNNRIRIQYESIHEVNWSKRRVNEKLFGGFYKFIRLCIKWLAVICVLILVFYYKEFEKTMTSTNDVRQEQIIVNVIDDATEKYVPTYSDVDKNEVGNTVDNTVNNTIME